MFVRNKESKRVVGKTENDKTDFSSKLPYAHKHMDSTVKKGVYDIFSIMCSCNGNTSRIVNDLCTIHCKKKNEHKIGFCCVIYMTANAILITNTQFNRLKRNIFNVDF